MQFSLNLLFFTFAALVAAAPSFHVRVPDTPALDTLNSDSSSLACNAIFAVAKTLKPNDNKPGRGLLCTMFFDSNCRDTAELSNLLGQDINGISDCVKLLNRRGGKQS